MKIFMPEIVNAFARCWCLILLLLPWQAWAFGEDSVAFEVQVTHPAMSKTVPQECLLWMYHDAGTHERHFEMQVASVICEDKKCSVVDVRLFWDDLGRYLRNQLGDGDSLEKFDGMPFLAADYQKLDEVLADTSSFLNEIDIEQRFALSAEDYNVDAVTGASANLNKNLYVQGALWTCYTLWHWVNGETRNVIRGITAREATASEFLLMLTKGDVAHQLFALQHLGQARNYDTSYLQAVLRIAPGNDYAVQKEILRYLAGAGQVPYTHALIKLLNTDDAGLRKICLKSMNLLPFDLPDGVVADVCRSVAARSEYQELDMLLAWLTKKNEATASERQVLFPLLNHQNLIVSRRVYWFLIDLPLSRDEQAQIDQYFREHGDVLE